MSTQEEELDLPLWPEERTDSDQWQVQRHCSVAERLSQSEQMFPRLRTVRDWLQRLFTTMDDVSLNKVN